MAVPTLSGHSGLSLPAIGLGTYSLDGNAGSAIIADAIGLGFRLLDSAVNYENEGAVGDAVRRCGLPRHELIVTSKLPGRHHDVNGALTTIEESAMRMGLDTIDLYLIHWPNPLEDRYVEAWTALLEARDRGLVRHIGVSNFLPEHLERLRRETGELPEVNQIELHPYWPQAEQLAYHRENGILTEAWSPLGRGSDLLANPVVCEIAARRAISAAQAVLAWHVHKGAIPIPKSRSAERLAENLAIFEISLSDDDVASLDSLSRGDGRLADQDPAVYQEF